MLILLRTMVGLQVAAPLASVSKIKVQKIAFQTIPLSILFVVSLTGTLSPTLSGLRSRPLSLFLLLLGFHIHKMHR